jgi:hypothetical protein
MCAEYVLGKFGTTAACRKSRIYLRSKENKADIRELGSFQFLSDRSILFAFTGNFRIGSTGNATLRNGQFNLLDNQEPGALPAEQTGNPHVTLHPSGICHIRVNDQKPALECNFGEWLPVEKPFLWLVIYSEPFYALKKTEEVKASDASVFYVDVLDIRKSLYLAVEILPRAPVVPCDREAASTIVGVCPEYFVRVTVRDHPPIGGIVFIPTGL